MYFIISQSTINSKEWFLQLRSKIPLKDNFDWWSILDNLGFHRFNNDILCKNGSDSNYSNCKSFRELIGKLNRVIKIKKIKQGFFGHGYTNYYLHIYRSIDD